MVAVRAPFRTALRLLLLFVVCWAGWNVWYRIELQRYQRAAAPILAEANASVQEASAAAAVEDDAARYYSAAAIAAIGEQPAQPLGLVQRHRAALMNGASLSARDRAVADQVLRRSEVSVSLAERGATLPFRRFAPGTSFNYRMSGMLSAHAAIALRTLDAIRAGDAATAGAAIFSRLRLMRALEPEIFPAIEKARQMSELAGDIGLWLALNASEVAIEQIAAALEEPYRQDGLIEALAKQAQFFWWGSTGENAARAGMLAPWLLHMSTPNMRSTAQAIDALRRPWPQRLAAIQRLADDGHQVIYRAQTTTINVAIGTAANRAARVALAAEMARRRGDTSSPVSQGRVSGDASIDPFTGEPLRFVRTGEGFVVYSLGSNGTDDGGSVEIPASGRAPNIPQGADVGVRVRR